ETILFGHPSENRPLFQRVNTLEVTLWGQKQGWTLPETLDRIGKRLEPASPQKGIGGEATSSISRSEPELFSDETTVRGSVNERRGASRRFQLYGDTWDYAVTTGYDYDFSMFPADKKPAWLPDSVYTVPEMRFRSGLKSPKGFVPFPINTKRLW